MPRATPARVKRDAAAAGDRAVNVARAVSRLARWRSRRRAARLAGHTKIDLLPAERAALMMCPAITTVTFFDGSATAAEAYLFERVAAIIKANPWLASVLDRDPDSGEMAAYYSATDAPTRRFFHVRTNVLSRDGANAMTYEAVIRALKPVILPTSLAAVGRGTPLFSVALLPDASAPHKRYALVVSINHCLLDGHSYYKIYNMLSADAPVQSLDPTRKQHIPTKAREALGGERSFSERPLPGFVLRVFYDRLRSKLFPLAKVITFDISATWLAEEKARHVDGQADARVPYVSTNDVATSRFFNCAEPNYAMMALDLRTKVKSSLPIGLPPPTLPVFPVGIVSHLCLIHLRRSTTAMRTTSAITSRP